MVAREDINRGQIKLVAEALSRLPGVDVGQNGSFSQQSSLFIHGVNIRHVLVLINGVRMNQAGISGASDLSQIPIALVQRIEYIRGLRSAVYSSDAIGSAVNITTTQEQEGSTFSAGMIYHSYQTYDGATRQKSGETPPPHWRAIISVPADLMFELTCRITMAIRLSPIVMAL